MSGMTFTTAYYVYICWDSSDVLSTDVWYNASTVSQSIATYVGKRQTSICTIVWYRLSKVGTIYWSIVMYINNGQMCALTFPGRGSVVRLVLLYQAPCCALFVVITVVLATEICTAWWSWQFDKRWQKFVMVKCHHHCADITVCAEKCDWH